MKINKAQKVTLAIGLVTILTVLLIWASFGAEIFTKTQVIIEKKDELLGTKYKEWKDQFVLGLDYTLAIVGMIGAISIIVAFIKRDKK